MPSYQSYNRRPDRLKAVFSPLVEKALQEIGCDGPEETMLRIADSMPIMMAKGQRASQATVASERTPDVGYCSSKDIFYHGVKLHVIAGKRSDKLQLPNRVGMMPGSENDLQALRRILPTIEGGVLCGDKAYCDGPLKERLVEDQDLDLLTAIKREGPEDAPSSRQALFRGRKPDQTADRVAFQLDRRENRHSVCLKGTFLPGLGRRCVRSARRCDVDPRAQPLIRI